MSQLSNLSKNEVKIRSGLIGVIIDRGYTEGSGYINETN